MGINDFGLHTIRANPPWDEQWTIKVATYWTVQRSMQYEYAAKLLNPSPTPSKYLTVVARLLIRYKTWYVPRTQVTKSLSTRYPCSTYKCLSIYILGTCHICTFDEQKTFIARSLSLWRGGADTSTYSPSLSDSTTFFHRHPLHCSTLSQKLYIVLDTTRVVDCCSDKIKVVPGREAKRWIVFLFCWVVLLFLSSCWLVPFCPLPAPHICNRIMFTFVFVYTY